MVVALVALFAALGGGAYAALKLPANSVGPAQLKKGAVTPPKLSPAAKTALSKPGPKGETGARGLEGPRGDAGPKGEIGPKGDTGTAAPGAASILNWDEAASATPVLKTIGTMLGDTFSAECGIPGAGEAEAKVYLQTSDGSLRWDVGTEVTENGTIEGRSTNVNKPMGTILVPTLVAGATATAGNASDHHSEIVQLAPVHGYLNVHTTASTQSSAQTCHVSVMGFPSN
jgi:hypothetical protein